MRGLVDEGLRPVAKRIRLVAFDFDGVFTDNTVYVSQEGSEMVRCWRGDGLGLRELERLGREILILSTEENPVVTLRSRKLRVDCVQGCPDKLAELTRQVRNRGMEMAQVAFVGNDVNDLPCLRSVGLPIVVGDAHPAVLPAALYTTRTAGGHGAVREVCDLFAYLLSPEPA